MPNAVEEIFTNGTLLLLGRDNAKRVFAARDATLLQQELNEIAAAEGTVAVDCQGNWGMLHRLLGDGSLDPQGGELPLNHCVLGGRPMDAGDSMTVRLARPDIVTHIATALAELDAAKVHSRFEAAAAAADEPNDEAAQQQLSALLEQVKKLYDTAARERAAVVFCVHQEA